MIKKVLKMTHLKTVSIVIPTFNRSDKVRKAIESSLQQTYKCEVIVVDHGSSDDTPSTVREYGDKITYIRKEQDLGPHFCWLDGVMHATGEFIHLQFDDDWIEKTFIDECLSLFNDNVGMVFTDAFIIGNHKKNPNRIYSHLAKGKYEKDIYNNSILEKELLFSGHRLISPAACVFRRQDIIDSLYQGLLPLKTGNSYHGVGPDLFMSLITLLRYDNFGYINKPLAYFGAHDESITVKASFDKQHQQKLIEAYNDVRVYYLGVKNLQQNYSRYARIVSRKNKKESFRYLSQI